MFGSTSQNIFGAKSTTTSAQSLTGMNTSTINLSSLAQFSTLGNILPDSIKTLVNIAHTKFLTPFDNRRFNRIGTLVERDNVVNGLTNYMNTITTDDSLVTFLDCIIKGVRASYNMKNLETTFITYKSETQKQIELLQTQVNVLLDSAQQSVGDAGGVGSANFSIELNNFFQIYIYIYGYHPNDETWITETRTNIVTDINDRINSGEIEISDVLPELYANT